MLGDRECDPDIGAALRQVARSGVAAVSLRDRTHDRQPEPDTATPSGDVGTAEAIERTASQILPEAAAAV